MRGILFLLLISVSDSLGAQAALNLNSSYRYLKGSSAGNLPAAWITDSYDDSGWSQGYAPFRYGDGTGGTELTDMLNSYSTLYLRTHFNAFSPDRIKDIVLTVNYDDGFVIWINGEMVLNANAPATLTAASLATANHESGVPVTYRLDSSKVHLVEGENTLCIQGLNVGLTSSDFYFDISLSASLSLPEVPDSYGISFDHAAGYYDGPFDLVITADASGYNLVYTLDGSNPQTSPAAIVSGSTVTVRVDPENTAGRPGTPAFIVRASLAGEGFSPSRPVTRTFIFIDKVLSQSHPGGSWPSGWANGQLIDLDMDNDVVSDLRYSGRMEASLLDVPAISLVTGNADLFDPASGIYVNAYARGEIWERQCSVELINPDQSEGFQVNAGVRIRGGASRTGDNPKHAFRLFFRKEYGPGKLRFPLFGDEGAAEFDKVDLRTAQNYSWSKDGDSHNTFLRDIFSRDLQRDMGQPYTRGRYYHLYLNGMYWGLFQTEERPEANFAESYLGDNEDDYDVIKVSAGAWPYFNEATDGTMAPWQDLWYRCSKGFTSNADYFALEGKDQNGKPVKNTRISVDIDNLIDYMLVIFYTGNVDGPVSAFSSNNMPNNYYAIFNRRNKGRGFVFIAHDSEHTMFIDPINVHNGINENRVTINDPYMIATGANDLQPQWLHDKLAKNAEYRLRFADRAYRYFAPGGVLSPEKCLESFRERRAEVEMPIIAESARWGDAKTVKPRNKNDDWVPEVNDIEKRFFPYRSQIVINQLKSAGLWSTMQPPIVKESGLLLHGTITLTGPKVITLENPNPTGKIYYTVDGSDPRLVGGAVSSAALTLASGSVLNVTGTTILRSRVVDGQTWSQVKEVIFSKVPEDYSALRVTEVQYHPADLINGLDTVYGTDLEFLELKNTGSNAMNISGLRIDSAVFFAVPDGTIIPPGGFFVVASKPEEFYSFYGMNPSGNFSGNLSNAGEFILITDKEGRTVLSFAYSDDSPWPESADGDGYSLVATVPAPDGDPGDHVYWKGSIKPGGSPFADDMTSTDVDETGDDPEKAALLVWPNPASAEITVSMDEPVADHFTVYLTDIDGNRVMTRSIENHSVINLAEAGLASGIYIVTAEYKGISRQARVVYIPE